MTSKMKLLLFGHGWAGCFALKYLLSESHEVFVYCNQTDDLSSLSTQCKQLGVNASFNSKDFTEHKLDFEAVVSMHCRQKIPKKIIEHVGPLSMNLHPSILPNYKGCSSLTWALFNGETEVGYSYHEMVEEFDSGNIIYQNKEPIFNFDTQATLYQRILFKSVEAFPTAFNLMCNKHRIQMPKGGMYYKRGAPFDGKIDPKWSDDKIARFIRAMYHPPYKPAEYNGNLITNLNSYFNMRKG